VRTGLVLGRQIRTRGPHERAYPLRPCGLRPSVQPQRRRVVRTVGLPAGAPPVGLVLGRPMPTRGQTERAFATARPAPGRR
jgi:hypothetical protein